MSLDIYLNIEVDTGGDSPRTIEIFSRNITHNVAPMWRKAGVWRALYESEGMLAGDLVECLEKGVTDMAVHRDEYEMLNPANGWGDYQGALDFLTEFTAECRSNPKAIVHVWS
jgi:hypothetical protein